ncbi:NRPS-like protein biosynthetic cluster [Penicillium cosmopolitanum]|uniref:NRPS-like protein biosynthetic cluster n=1 Tax=Penicillium cosmopolitanum TaxID=1131564 RepID=A0A9W9WB68_9EURO|nr:NRPS-like protein biosynthetic cluster [Penicillium cosmopolitanum]KAJ5414131.1 NRPS-like protein biosynthetic cluster [Penicillium cosmopolitanum]
MAPTVSDMTVHFRHDRSVTQMMLENTANVDPNKVISEDILTGKTITYETLRGEAFKAAWAFRHRLGLKVGDTVTIIGRSCVDYIIATHAIWAAGGVVSTINHSSSAKEIAHAVKVIKPHFFIVDGIYQRKLREALTLAQHSEVTISTMVSRLDGHLLFPNDFLTWESKRVEPEAYVLDGQDARTRCAALVLSSGTTGLPKAVMLSHYNLTGICEALRGHNPDNWRESMREVFFPPLSHIYGLYVCALMGPWLGYYVCMVPQFELDTYCRLMHEKHATLARLVPPVAVMLAENPIVDNYQYPNLEYFSCSAAPLKPAVASKLRNRFPLVSLCQTYGCTELSSCIAQSGVRDKDAPLVAAGTLLANVKIQFLDEQGKEVPAGQPGEIVVSTPTIMLGYKDNDEGTRESMHGPEWYKTGDLGYLDDKGYLIIVDRLKDVIKYKGFQISPTELEEIIGRHPMVKDSGVTSIWDDAEGTEIPLAFVVPQESTSSIDRERMAMEVQNLVAGEVAGYKKLRGGVWFIDQLPRNPTGKMLRRELRKKAASKAQL